MIEITFANEFSEVHTMKIDPDCVLRDIQPMIQVEFRLPPPSQVLYFNGKLLDLSLTLRKAGIMEHDIILVANRLDPSATRHINRSSSVSSTSSVSSVQSSYPKPTPIWHRNSVVSLNRGSSGHSSSPLQMTGSFPYTPQAQSPSEWTYPGQLGGSTSQNLQNLPTMVPIRAQQPPTLHQTASTVPSNILPQPAPILPPRATQPAPQKPARDDPPPQQVSAQNKEEVPPQKPPQPVPPTKKNSIGLSSMDVKQQEEIYEKIRKENVNSNMKKALEEHPESFGRVTMLYVDLKVNGVDVKAFVDSGAQMTVISPECAKRCNVMHLIDDRYKGVAVGVGSSKILGRIHSACITIGSQYLLCSLTVIEGQNVELLFGLDMLRRHHAIIDLIRDVLSLNGEDIPFLAEHQIPKNQWEIATTTAGTSSATSTNQSPSSSSNAAPKTKTKPMDREESMIQQLMSSVGVSREQAKISLKKCSGNLELAADYLLSNPRDPR